MKGSGRNWKLQLTPDPWQDQGLRKKMAKLRAKQGESLDILLRENQAKVSCNSREEKAEEEMQGHGPSGQVIRDGHEGEEL